MISLRQLIQAHWKPQGSGLAHRVEIFFSLGSDGTIRQIQIQDSSGDPLLDRSTEEAVRTAQPYFHSPPTTDPALNIVATFNIHNISGGNNSVGSAFRSPQGQSLIPNNSKMQHSPYYYQTGSQSSSMYQGRYSTQYNPYRSGSGASSTQTAYAQHRSPSYQTYSSPQTNYHSRQEEKPIRLQRQKRKSTYTAPSDYGSTSSPTQTQDEPQQSNDQDIYANPQGFQLLFQAELAQMSDYDRDEYKRRFQLWFSLPPEQRIGSLSDFQRETKS